MPEPLMALRGMPMGTKCPRCGAEMIGLTRDCRTTYRCLDCGVIVTVPGERAAADAWVSRIWRSEAKRRCETCRQACKRQYCPWWPKHRQEG